MGHHRWYEAAGKYLAKRNTFTDFVDCAEHLLASGVAKPGSLSCEGRSAGGLLVGNVVNMAPEKFCAAIGGVPFVDLMVTMCDPSIPLTTEEWEEWGNPNEAKYYEYMRSYSPIDNVREGVPYPKVTRSMLGLGLALALGLGLRARDARVVEPYPYPYPYPSPYPKVLIVSGLNDPRVAYWEPTKWAQVLRAKVPNGREVLLKMDPNPCPRPRPDPHTDPNQKPSPSPNPNPSPGPTPTPRCCSRWTWPPATSPPPTATATCASSPSTTRGCSTRSARRTARKVSKYFSRYTAPLCRVWGAGSRYCAAVDTWLSVTVVSVCVRRYLLSCVLPSRMRRSPEELPCFSPRKFAAPN